MSIKYKFHNPERVFPISKKICIFDTLIMNEIRALVAVENFNLSLS
jgi:hypothetical protein